MTKKTLKDKLSNDINKAEAPPKKKPPAKEATNSRDHVITEKI